jgi:hypothetical protein
LTLHGLDLIAITAMVFLSVAACYFLLIRNLDAIVADRLMKVADQIGTLDDAVRAVETRLREHQIQAPLAHQRGVLQAAGSSIDADESGEIAPEIQAAIAAAAVATLGPNAVVHSLRPVPSPWTQQGRVLVQGGHNLRLRR